MSETEVDGQPENVDERHGPVTESADLRRRGGAWQSALIVGPLMLGLVVVAGIGAKLLLADLPDPSATEEPKEVVCWDGEVRHQQDCGTPTGRAGLRWMFPSFEPSEGNCRDVPPEHPKSTRPAMFECRGHVPSGSVRITYSELTTVERGRAHLQKQYGSSPKELDDELGRRLLWKERGKPGGDEVYELNVMYAALPFAVEIRSRSAKARDAALQRLVRFRPEDDAFVRSTDVPANP